MEPKIKALFDTIKTPQEIQVVFRQADLEQLESALSYISTFMGVNDPAGGVWTINCNPWSRKVVSKIIELYEKKGWEVTIRKAVNQRDNDDLRFSAKQHYHSHEKS